MTARRITVVSCWLAAGVLVGQGSSAWPAPPPTPSAMVVVARAVSGCFSDTIRVTGFLVPRDEALVTLDADGYRIVEILVAEGDRVTAGHSVAQADDGPRDRATRARARCTTDC